MPNPATKGLPHAASYDLGAASVVIDNVTGLMWQKEGFLQLSPEEAASQCAELELDGHCDWRLPTRIELVSLVDFSRDMVAFDPAAFPGAQGEYLSASLLDGHRFFVGSDGATRLRTQTQVPRGSARCVRRHREEPAPEPRYTFAGQAPNDTVRDHGTGLVWQRRPSDSTYTFDEAQDYCAALVIDGGGFRAPSMKELQTLLDERGDSGPPIDADVFPGFPATLNATFWTSSRSARSEANAWFVRGGSTLDAAVDAGVEASFYVRCVK